MNLIQLSILRSLVAGVAFCLALSGARADVFVSNHGGSDIYRYDDSGHFLGRHLTGLHPLGMTFGPDGGLYVHKYGANQTSRFDPVSGSFAPFTSGGYGSELNPHQIAFGGPDKDLYVAEPQTGVILRFDGTTGAFESRIEGLGVGVVGVAVDAAGSVYASSRSGVIYKYSAGALSTFATSSTGYEALTIGPDGNLYAGTTDGSRVVRYRPDGTPFGAGGSTTDPTFIDDSRLTYAFAASFGLDGNIYVSNIFKSNVLRFAPDGTFMDTFIASGLTNPTYMAFGSFAPPPTLVPEPATFVLFALGLAAVGSSLRRRAPCASP